jgi:integrase
MGVGRSGLSEGRGTRALQRWVCQHRHHRRSEPKTLSTYLGHATITITLDRYGHLMPGSEVEARAMLDAYLDGPSG